MKKAGQKRIDPDPISIGTFLLATLGVLLQLEAKVTERREVSRRRRSVRARAIASEAIDEIQQAISVFETFWAYFTEIGTTQAGQIEVGFGNAQKYLTEEEYTSVLERLDVVLDNIGDLNKAVQRILFADFELDEVTPDSLENLRFQCRVLREACNRVLFSGRETANSFLIEIPKLLNQARRFTRDLRLALQLDPPLG